MTVTQEAVEKVKFTKSVYYDCKQAGLMREEIAEIFDMTMDEYKKQEKEMIEKKCKGKVSVFSYEVYKDIMNKTTDDKVVASLAGVSLSTVKTRKKIWGILGLPLTPEELEKFEKRKLHNKPKLNLVKFSTLRDLKYTDAEIAEKVGVTLNTIRKRKKEWKEIGLMDAIGQVTSKTVKAFTVEDYLKYKKQGINHKDMAERSSVNLSTIKEYIESWEDLCILPNRVEQTLPVNKEVLELQNEVDEYKNKYKEAVKDMGRIAELVGKFKKENQLLKNKNKDLDKVIVDILTNNTLHKNKESFFCKVVSKIKKKGEN